MTKRPDRGAIDSTDAQLIPFPSGGPSPVGEKPVTGAVEVAPEVLDGDVISEEEYGFFQGLRRSVIATRMDRDKTSTGPVIPKPVRVVVRAGWMVGQGHASWARRGYDALTHGPIREQIRLARVTGNSEALAEWSERLVKHRDSRHKRLRGLPATVISTLHAAGIALCVILALLVAGAAWVTVNHGMGWDQWWAGVGNFLNGTLTVLSVAVRVALWCAVPAWCVAAWREGLRRGEPPRWLVQEPADNDVMDGLPDEGTIVKSLRNLNIRGFNLALKEGWVIRFRQPPTVDGKGWRCQLDLPPACPVEEIVKRKPMLAHNLLRYPIEVWPTEPQAGVLDLWIANSGALSGPVDPWPLLADLDNTTADYFAGVPAGVTIRGDVVRGRLSEANYVIGGMMGSGKSTLVITLLLGAMLDPLVDIDVVIMAENADYDPMKPRLRSLVTGAGDETALTCLAMLADLYEDLSIRGQALRDHDARAVTRKLAQADERLRPRIMVIDECQALFIGEHSKTALEITAKLMSAARKYAITLMFLTPEPSKDALPRKLITISSNKACFAIGDQYGNDAVLGTGSYKAGISAVGLTPKTDEDDGDVGTCMARGFTARPGLLRSYYVPQADAHRVTERAMRLREELGGHATTTTVARQADRDLLEDLDEVLDTQVVMAPDVPALLRSLAPQWGPYRSMTGTSLVAELAMLGVKVPRTHNRWPVDPADVRAALARAATADLDDDD